MITSLKKHWPRMLTHLACLIPFAVLAWDYQRDNLTANPIQEMTQRTGKTALILLVLSLAITPLNRLLGLRQVQPLRRPLGLYAFAYAALHLVIFVYVDYGLDLELLQEAMLEKRYALVGLAAFLILLPLALTSTKGWMRRLGKRWTSLHRLVYVAAGLVVVHFVWLVKSDVREPLLYGAAIGLLLLLRLPPLRRAITTWRQRRAALAQPSRRDRPARPEAAD